ncbi:MAG TPA: glycosyltransferase family 4 protein [Stellaceae bacterium]|jgi:glycosyltransferase involved in cell wall biosynthesis
MSDFDQDPHPDSPRILFVGWPDSSHTHSWIELLQDVKLNLRLFGLYSSEPPLDWPVKTYLTAPTIRRRNGPTRRTVFPPPTSSPYYAVYLYREAMGVGNLVPTSGLRGLLSGAAAALDRVYAWKYPRSLEDALARVVRSWRPDIIHTLGFDAASYLYLSARKRYGLAGIGRWIAQARGGPDLALNRHSSKHLPRIREVLATCDHFIADNQQNYDYALAAGLDRSKIADPGIGVVSGPGGLDLEALRARWTLPPSRRERIVVWPKAYEINSAKAMPVFEAILQAWDRIQPCRIEMLWMTQPEVQIWYDKLFPDEIKRCCPTHPRLSHEETIALIARARVMMAPSLSDGIPNTMTEAMALGAAPLVSPLDTIVPVVREGENVLFARNLYPDEIAAALVRLMTDDALVDRLAANNLVRVRELADRNAVRARAIAYYGEVAALARRGTPERFAGQGSRVRIQNAVGSEEG